MVTKDFLLHYYKYNFYFEKLLHKVQNWHELDDSKIYEIKNDIFIRQLKAVHKNSRFYKDFYSKKEVDISTISTIDDINILPVLTKEDIKGKQNEILIGKRFLRAKGYTSGTSGSPLEVFRDFNSILLENAFVWNLRLRAGLRVGDPVITIRGNLNEKQLFQYNKYENSYYLSSYNLENKYISNYYKIITEHKPKAIFAYPSSIYLLAKLFESRGIAINIPLIFTSSETLFPFQKELIEKIFNCDIYDWYGNAERTIAIQQMEDAKYYEVPLYSHVEYNPDYLITTSLINRSFPLIRYRVDDKISLSSDQKNRVVNTVKIEALEGRSDDYIITKSGKHIGRLDIAFKGIKGISAAQIIQEKLGEIIVHIVREVGTDFMEQYLEENLISLVGSEISILFRYISDDELIRTKNGKLRLVLCNLN